MKQRWIVLTQSPDGTPVAAGTFSGNTFNSYDAARVMADHLKEDQGLEARVLPIHKAQEL